MGFVDGKCSTMTERFNVLALKASVGLISTQGSNPCRADCFFCSGMYSSVVEQETFNLLARGSTPFTSILKGLNESLAYQ